MLSTTMMTNFESKNMPGAPRANGVLQEDQALITRGGMTKNLMTRIWKTSYVKDKDLGK